MLWGMVAQKCLALEKFAGQGQTGLHLGGLSCDFRVDDVLQTCLTEAIQFTHIVALGFEN